MGRLLPSFLFLSFLSLLLLAGCAPRPEPAPTLAEHAAALKAACNAACAGDGAREIALGLPPRHTLYASEDAVCVRSDGERTMLACGTCGCEGYGLEAAELARSEDAARNVTCAFSLEGEAVRATCT